MFEGAQCGNDANEGDLIGTLTCSNTHANTHAHALSLTHTHTHIQSHTHTRTITQTHLSNSRTRVQFLELDTFVCFNVCIYFGPILKFDVV